jgi:hypothetical protein
MIKHIKIFLIKFLRFQHTWIPIPLDLWKLIFKNKILHKFFYKYFVLCFDTDYNYKKPNSQKHSLQYWQSKRSLYWHYAHLHHNRFSKIFKKIYSKYNILFKDKVVCDLMCGLSPFFQDKNISKIFIEENKYCVEILKKICPTSKIINGKWDIIEKYIHLIDTVFISSGCLIFLNYKEIDLFFKITKDIKNFVIIHEGTDLDDKFYEYSGHYLWNFKKRLKKFNIHYKKSKIIFEKTSDGISYDYFYLY